MFPSSLAQTMFWKVKPSEALTTCNWDGCTASVTRTRCHVVLSDSEEQAASGEACAHPALPHGPGRGGGWQLAHCGGLGHSKCSSVVLSGGSASTCQCACTTQVLAFRCVCVSSESTKPLPVVQRTRSAFLLCFFICADLTGQEVHPVAGSSGCGHVVAGPGPH